MSENEWRSSPIRGVAPITARFGERGPNWTNKHTGVDFSAITGTPVVAVQSGIVMKADWENNAYGNIVKINHTVAEGTLETWYAHLSSVRNFDLPEAVSKGEMIGRVGSTGNTTGPHTHLEVKRNGTAVDPSEYLGLEVEPNPDDVGQQMGINNPWPDVDLGEFGIRAGMFAGGAALIIVGGYGLAKGNVL